MRYLVEPATNKAVGRGGIQGQATIAQRISRPDDVMAQVNNHSVDQVMHGLLPKRVLDTVLDVMSDHEKLSLEVLDNESKSRAFALVILKMLAQQAGLAARVG